MNPGIKKILLLIEGPTCNKKGLTIIELAIIFSIISITSVLSFPSLTSLWSNIRLNKATRDLMVNFHRAKMEAIKRNMLCTTTFNVSLNGQDYDYVVYVDSDQDHEYDAGETILSSIKLDDYKSGVDFDPNYGGGDGVDFDNNDNGRPSVAFNPLGLPINKDEAIGTFRARIINNHSNTKVIVIGPAGRIRITL